MAQSDSQIEGRGSDYPVQFSVDYQESSNRLSVLPRILLAIPILVVFAVIGGAIDTGDPELNEALMPLYAGGFLLIGPLLMILFRKKYPRWWFDWNLELSRFTSRVTAFLLLLRDEYPSTDEEQSVHLQIEYPNAETDLNRILPIFKWLLAIPHYIALTVLGVLDFAGHDTGLAVDLAHRPVSPRTVRVRGWRVAVGHSRRRLRLPADDGPLSALPVERIGVGRLPGLAIGEVRRLRAAEKAAPLGRARHTQSRRLVSAPSPIPLPTGERLRKGEQRGVHPGPRYDAPTGESA